MSFLTPLPSDLRRLQQHLRALIHQGGGRTFLVGGCVRDLLLGQAPKDLDLEVYGLSYEELRVLLQPHYPVDLVGQSFAVLKLRGLPIDLSLPRRERRVAPGHCGVTILADPTMSLDEAAARRDFTINALAYDLLTEHLHDPFGGQLDLIQRLLRHTSDRFVEDPLRVLRGLQFAGRFDLLPTPGTVELCRRLRSEYPTLAQERIWGEWEKWAALSRVPSRGLHFLDQSGWLAVYPELAALQGCPQDPQWHPEGDVWTHTCLVTNEAATIADRDGLSRADRVVLLMAALCHDLGKPATTTQVGARLHAYGHAEQTEPIERLLVRLGTPASVRARVLVLCRHHLVHASYTGSSRQVRRLAHTLAQAGETLAMLARLVDADLSGRPPLPKGLPPAMQALMTQAETLSTVTTGPPPLVLGRHLLALGLSPGPRMGALLRAAFQAQLDGAFTTTDAGLAWIRQHAAEFIPPPQLASPPYP